MKLKLCVLEAITHKILPFFQNTVVQRMIKCQHASGNVCLSEKQQKNALLCPPPLQFMQLLRLTFKSSGAGGRENTGLKKSYQQGEH